MGDFSLSNSAAYHFFKHFFIVVILQLKTQWYFSTPLFVMKMMLKTENYSINLNISNKKSCENCTTPELYIWEYIAATEKKTAFFKRCTWFMFAFQIFYQNVFS